jgi:molybdopterin/thiamine biosynthesis adenylyltransferase
VGKIILADFDYVDPSNLNRQILHHKKDIEGLWSSNKGKASFYELGN